MRLILVIAWLFIEAWGIGAAADQIGGLPVFVLLLLIAAAGLQLIKRQGYRTLLAVQSAMQRNELPTSTMLDSLVVFVAGLLLILPGFVSDALALVLLFSGFRRRLITHAETFIVQRHPEFREPTIIDGEYHEVEDYPVIEHDEHKP